MFPNDSFMGPLSKQQQYLQQQYDFQDYRVSYISRYHFLFESEIFVF